jgi:hypothetical protein
MAESLLSLILPHLDRTGVPDRSFPNAKGEYYAHCPYHRDEHPTNFSVSERGFRCFACGARGSLRDLAGKLDTRWHGGTVARRDSKDFYSLAQYAKDKQLPESFLRCLGLSDRKTSSVSAVRMPYRDAMGKEVSARYRCAATGDHRFRWTQGSKVLLYGLDRLDRNVGYVHLVEGDSDAQTLWFHGEPALGVPGATVWKPEWAERLDGLTVYVWREPDKAGSEFVQRIAQSLPDIKVLAPPPGRKDISDCHLLGDDVPAVMARLRASAKSYRAIRAEQASAAGAEAKLAAGALLGSPNLLDQFVELCRAQGLVGEERTVKLLYLALTSRLLQRPVSVIVKGPSSGGKSFTVVVTLKAFPPSAYHSLTSMSPKHLAYGTESLDHRHLVVFEAEGLASDTATYLIRTLLSEGCIKYATVEKTSEGLKPRVIERAGPTGLILTTTAPSLHPENETRMFSVTTRDTVQQTSSVLHALAGRANGHEPKPVDFTPWHALQDWLQLAGSHEVAIPYADPLAARADNRSVRFRRDFAAILNLISAHAILQQEMRERDACGRVVATVDDYTVVYDLVIDIVSEGVQASVQPEIRETVEAVRSLDVPNSPAVTYKRVGELLGLDKSAARRRCEVAIREGYLVNKQERRNQPSVLAVSDPLPEDTRVLPSPGELMSLIPPQPPCHRATGRTPGWLG